MTSFQAFVLGIVQGLTEWLPISSTAHLKVVPELLGWEPPTAAFSAVIQWGTLIAALVYFRRDIVLILRDWFVGLYLRKPFATPEARLGWMIIAGTIPIVVLGLWLQGQIEGKFRLTVVIAWAAILGALGLMVAELWHTRMKSTTNLRELTWFQAIIVGLAQAVALVPGASRSGVTITGALSVGMSRDAAARYSFLLSLPAVFGAGLHQLVKYRRELLAAEDGAFNLVLATVVSGIVGYATIPLLITILKRYSTAVFIVYRLMLGPLILLLLSWGYLKG